MILSQSLSTIPFGCTTDPSRMQMAAKQMSQALLYENQRHPYVISSDYRYLSENSKFFKLNAEDNGRILFHNDELMVFMYDNINKLDTIYLPLYLETKSSFAVKLVYKKEIGDFQKGDLLYSYNGFSLNNNIPIYGHNLNTLYSPFLGFTYEDAIVISEEAAEKLKHRKFERIVIPVYLNTFMKPIFESKFKYFPDINDHITNRIIAGNVVFKKDNMELYNLEKILKSFSDDTTFDTELVYTKLRDCNVKKIRVHRITNKKMIFKELDEILNELSQSYLDDIKNTEKDMISHLGHRSVGYVNNIINNYYKIAYPKQVVNNTVDLKYLIEIEVLEDRRCYEGDKLTNMHGGKGIASIIIPTGLMPIDEYGKRIHLIQTGLSVFGRKNFGQCLAGLIGRCVEYIEDKIIKKVDKNEILNDLTDLIIILRDFDEEYFLNTSKLIESLKDDKIYEKFYDDVIENGLFVECPSFYNVDICEINDKIYNTFGFKTNIKVTYSKELIKYLTEKVKIDMPIPDDDCVLDDVFCVPTYILNLYKLSHELVRGRDVGSSNPITGINTKSTNLDPVGSRIGYMEILSLISVGMESTLKEFSNAKSDNLSEKTKLHTQFINDGEYIQSEKMNKNGKSNVGKIIESYLLGISYMDDFEEN